MELIHITGMIQNLSFTSLEMPFCLLTCWRYGSRVGGGDGMAGLVGLKMVELETWRGRRKWQGYDCLFSFLILIKIAKILSVILVSCSAKGSKNKSR